jgi:hypothetical protein
MGHDAARRHEQRRCASTQPGGNERRSVDISTRLGVRADPHLLTYRATHSGSRDPGGLMHNRRNRCTSGVLQDADTGCGIYPFEYLAQYLYPYLSSGYAQYWTMCPYASAATRHTKCCSAHDDPTWSSVVRNASNTVGSTVSIIGRYTTALAAANKIASTVGRVALCPICIRVSRHPASPVFLRTSRSMSPLMLDTVDMTAAPSVPISVRPHIGGQASSTISGICESNIHAPIAPYARYTARSAIDRTARPGVARTTATFAQDHIARSTR